jgi:hypothetical protein
MLPSSQGYLYIPRHRDKTPIWPKLLITLCAVGVAVLSGYAWYDYNKEPEAPTPLPNLGIFPAPAMQPADVPAAGVPKPAEIQANLAPIKPAIALDNTYNSYSPQSSSMLFVPPPIIIGATPKPKLKVKRPVEPAVSPYDVVVIDGVPYVSGREPHDLGTVEGTSDDTASLNNSAINDIANDSK